MSKGLPKPWQSMSARLLLLTIGFVMVAEVLIFAPSIGRYWESWLEERLAAGHLSVLALAATPNQAIDGALEAELLSHVGAYSVSVRTDSHGKLMLMASDPPKPIGRTFDLETSSGLDLIVNALEGLVSSDNAIIRVVGTSPQVPHATVAIVIDDAPLMEDLRQFALRIFLLSLVISVITASLVYLSLHLLLVRPMRRVTENMVAFQDDPEHSPIYRATRRRSDEIGLAERALEEMQQGLRDSLRQKTRLAALGTAVSKINHDLRNILTTARLVSDSMADSADPRVRRVAPTLIKAIDRAVDLCARTLAFARGGEMRLETGPVNLAALVSEVRRSLPASLSAETAWMVDIPTDLTVLADRDQLYRVLANLAQNAVEAGATQLDVSAGLLPDGKGWSLRLADNGPGLPPRARENLFKPFSGSARAGGTGLGLAIVREIVEAHGGRIALVESAAEGTTFSIELPGGRVAAPAQRGLREQTGTGG
ncbi:MAG: HAMP domain-containing sensor histidine kinase [Rhodospirillales bacterium]